MAKKPNIQNVKTELSQRIAKCVNFGNTQLATQWQFNLEQYFCLPFKEDEKIRGTSKHIVPVLRDHVDLFTAQVVRILDGQKNVVSFAPLTASPQDKLIAEQQTRVVQHVLREKNSHVALLTPWVKNSGIFGLGVAHIDFTDTAEEGLVETLKGVTDEQLVQIVEDEKAGKIIIEATGDDYRAEIPPEIIEQIGMATGGQIDPSMIDPSVIEQLVPTVRDIEIRKIKKTPQFTLKALAPEDFIVSVDADINPMTGGITASIQGHRTYTTKQALIEEGYDPKLVDEIPLAQEKSNGTATVRARKTSYNSGQSDDGDLVEVYEIFTHIAIDDKKKRHYRITIGGNPTQSPIFLGHYEVSKYYPYAPLVPYPVPNTLFGQGLGDRLGADQVMISKMYRAMINNLNYVVDPIKIINPDVTNMDDTLNIHPGKVIRSENPTGGISYNPPQLAAPLVLPVLDMIDQRHELSTGVGRSMISVDAADLQDVTATAARQRSSMQQMLIEQVCRHYADTGYRYLAKIIIDLMISKSDMANLYIARLTEENQPFAVGDDWDSDMDVSTNVEFGAMDKDLKQSALLSLLQLQQQGLGQTTTPQNIYKTLIDITETMGIQGAAQYWTDPAQMPPAPQPPTEAESFVQMETVKAQLKAQSDEKKRDFDAYKLRVEDDLKRDQMVADIELKRAEIAARFAADVDIARIQAEQAAARYDVDWARQQEQNRKVDESRLEQEKQMQAMMAQSQLAQSQPQPPMI